ncbi:MAG: helix-hairpin-helix domain-containing protein [Spiribacter sp.]|jgi:competence protein ComEA|nr:helix-hairpin-helix domain-containing protein [Spiribacter sp.]MDR9489621.1 helix-hairpin-helix domain-containing protein [Spiribacter sp.]
MALSKAWLAGSSLAFVSGLAGANIDAVNINAAGVDALQSLDGVGPATAEAIIEDRSSNGDYPSIDALTRVNGIGEATLEVVRERITLE